MSVGKVHEKLGEAKKAAEHMSEALRIFKRTVGKDSPLTAHALGALGKVKATMGGEQLKEALVLLKQARAWSRACVHAWSRACVRACVRASVRPSSSTVRPLPSYGRRSRSRLPRMPSTSRPAGSSSRN